MGVTQDRAMARLADPVLLGALLQPRARFLVERTHELEYERIDSVTALRTWSASCSRSTTSGSPTPGSP
ncbi:hypothetical protein DWB77_07385 [Streptomyces hundungensis]|uniref:Uncharacterized protein n=1 Tax=Streptomyces hundungensis TaxID=1077946 RepID=A0A387HSL0_9ACTN|nr:hypothetical protein [Streptomyces hundungensis]AYG85168.1 hypothetical protein DWB77_07385 [Streptomyces hundungensis]